MDVIQKYSKEALEYYKNYGFPSSDTSIYIQMNKFDWRMSVFEITEATQISQLPVHDIFLGFQCNAVDINPVLKLSIKVQPYYSDCLYEWEIATKNCEITPFFPWLGYGFPTTCITERTDPIMIDNQGYKINAVFLHVNSNIRAIIRSSDYKFIFPFSTLYLNGYRYFCSNGLRLFKTT